MTLFELFIHSLSSIISKACCTRLVKSLKVFTPRNPIDKTWQTSVIYRIHAKPPMEDQKKVKAALRNFAPASQKKECTFVDPDLC
jgi:hypothetical protein